MRRGGVEALSASCSRVAWRRGAWLWLLALGWGGAVEGNGPIKVRGFIGRWVPPSSCRWLFWSLESSGAEHAHWRFSSQKQESKNLSVARCRAVFFSASIWISMRRRAPQLARSIAALRRFRGFLSVLLCLDVLEPVDRNEFMGKYYAYVIEFETDYGDVMELYVGSGTGGRAQLHLGQSPNPGLKEFIRWAREEGVMDQVRARIVDYYETRMESDVLERELIAEIGRTDLHQGPLFNRNSGGGGARDAGPATKERMATNGRRNIMAYNSIRTPEEMIKSAARMRESLTPEIRIAGGKKGIAMVPREAKSRGGTAVCRALAARELTCPHCGKTGHPGTMKRWHFDRCLKKTGEEARYMIDLELVRQIEGAEGTIREIAARFGVGVGTVHRIRRRSSQRLLEIP
jgi:hypothetical protein